MNYFQILNIETRYDINLKELSNEYLSLQKQYHPDKARTEEEKKKNLKISMNINNAYNTLKNDISRAEYLLQINNEFIKNTTISSPDLEKTLQDQEQLELIKDIVNLEAYYIIKIEEYGNFIARLNSAFTNNNLKDALAIVVSLKYLTKLLENIKLKIKNANSRNLRT